MNLIKFITWLSTGAIIGWFASRMVERERRHNTDKKVILVDSGD
jgi:uncharacterized membrane protein YeaQ/YmgE (transglycosylase-associated protein family)